MADLINLTIDDEAIEAAPGTLVIHTAKQNGIEIPAFCYYQGLRLQAAWPQLSSGGFRHGHGRGGPLTAAAAEWLPHRLTHV
jgi:hypothetical protein